MQPSFESWMYQLETVDLTIAAAILSIELVRDLLTRRISWNGLGDILASLSTQIPFFLVSSLTVGGAILLYYTLWYVTPVHLPNNIWTIAAAILVADFAYYWEHRAAHRVRIFWFSHAVHHSAPKMNVAVAYRFGPFEPLMSVPFHAPMVLLGFDPLLVIFAELMVLSYQTWLHTELIGKLGFLDRIFNTPSNHRVHHGSNDAYLDKNYGGILILWDRLFGTYAAEEEKVVYGLTTQIETVNPIKVWFSELPGLWRDLIRARTAGDVAGYLFRPPGWEPSGEKGQGKNVTIPNG
ncbi:sterol desaturase family protein [Aestuariispira insulae]|uniref:Fatty acid hydroxylase family protein n=1 Tax=Aestuariispira insulae TaxID=1461337 RepID=A0A3D9HP90_9PROT|nr:sterol desaturase family protein [Aestuariispira insulae]RED51313.1 fatty acid hydroxylase family protein [Aestuariispira insulae]